VGEAEELVLGVQQQRDDLRAPGAQTTRGPVGDVAQPFCGLGDGRTGARGDSLIVRQGAGTVATEKPVACAMVRSVGFSVPASVGRSRFRASSAASARKLRHGAFCSVFQTFQYPCCAATALPHAENR
jgi:hypothetical protein